MCPFRDNIPSVLNGATRQNCRITNSPSLSDPGPNCLVCLAIDPKRADPGRLSPKHSPRVNRTEIHEEILNSVHGPSIQLYSTLSSRMATAHFCAPHPTKHEAFRSRHSSSEDACPLQHGNMRARVFNGVAMTADDFAHFVALGVCWYPLRWCHEELLLTGQRR